MLYLDLNNFKAYNDTYGFKNGDRVIKLPADILVRYVCRALPPQGQNNINLISHCRHALMQPIPALTQERDAVAGRSVGHAPHPGVPRTENRVGPPVIAFATGIVRPGNPVR